MISGRGKWLRSAAIIGLSHLCLSTVSLRCLAEEAIRHSLPRRNEIMSEATAETGATKGISFPIDVTSEVLGNISGGTRQTAIWESLWIAGVAVDFEKACGVRGLSLAINGLYAQGSGLTDKAVHDFNTLSNIDAYDSLRLYDAWLQQEFGDGRFSIRIGQLLADAEFFVSDYGEVFMNSSFGAIPLVSGNFNPPIFPVAAPGVRLRAMPNESFYAEVAAFSGDVGDPATNNKHNTRFSFPAMDGMLIFAEAGYTHDAQNSSDDSSPKGQPADAAVPRGLSGSYKIGGCYDSGQFAATNGLSAHHNNYSIYFIAQQELWHPDFTDRALSAFARIGFAPENRNTVTFYLDTGLNFRGPISSRPEDILALGFSYVKLSQELRDENNHHFPNHHEAVLELTYSAAVNSHLSIQPDLQCIIDPGALHSSHTAVVAGLRFNVKF